ncbi:unnamed protein product [Rhizophagus irregularis]|nr:unnamed protein product [Rhizophagus irregularis]
MNNYQEIIFFPFKQQMQRFYSSTFEYIRFRNDYIVKRRTNYNQNLLNFIIWYFVFFSFSLFPFVSASIAPYIDKSYDSHEDLYDALLNTFFPIFFVILLNVSGEPGSKKNVLLPLLDDVLYNMVTWVIPLIVSFSYDDLMSIKIFSIINMCLHVFCATYAIIRWKKVTENVLSLTRNVSYFSDKVPKDFLATSTTVVQCRVRYAFKGSDVNKIFNMTDEMDEMKTKIDRMQTKIDEMQKTINEMKNING